MTKKAPGERRLFVRSMYAGRDVELFMVTAFATIFLVRGALAATGWPQLGGGKIHFAHLLWGGLGMLIGLLTFMAMQGRLWRVVATLVAGIGFGLFIDELGKFVTSDNDYFYQPAIAFIYLIFVALFIVGRAVLHDSYLSPQSALVNAFDVAKEAVIRDLDETERDKGLALLGRCDQSDPVIRGLTQLLSGMTPETKRAPRLLQRWKGRGEDLYLSLTGRRWFRTLLVAYLVAFSLVSIAAAAIYAAVAARESVSGVEFWELGQVLSSLVSALLIVVGVVRWRHSRLTAYRWFRRALLVTLFITEFFAFYQNQSSQFFGLVFTLFSYAAIAAMIRQEEAGSRVTVVDEAAATRTGVEEPVT